MKLEYTIFGESHGPAIGVVIENLPSGIPVDENFISREMDRRRAKGDGLSTPRMEADVPRILSGVFEGKTTGTPLCAIIENGNTRSTDYTRTKDLLCAVQRLQRLSGRGPFFRPSDGTFGVCGSVGQTGASAKGNLCGCAHFTGGQRERRFFFRNDPDCRHL